MVGKGPGRSFGARSKVLGGDLWNHVRSQRTNPNSEPWPPRGWVLFGSDVLKCFEGPMRSKAFFAPVGQYGLLELEGWNHPFPTHPGRY